MDLQDTPDDIDSILSEVHGQSEQTTEQPASSPEAPPSQPSEYEIDWNGQKIKAPIDRITQWASQGYDYSQKMAQFKKQQAELAEKYKPYEKYKQIDEYVQKDPKWWTYVEQQYQNRLSSEDPVTRTVKAMLDEELKPVKELLSLKEQEATQRKIQEEDSALANEIKSIRAKYKDLDFDSPDATGKSLELKVLEHGAENGFPSFKAAFLDFYHEQLEKMWESRGREAVSKDVQKRQKLGLSTSSTPRKSDAYDVRGKSYNQILDDIMQSFS